MDLFALGVILFVARGHPFDPWASAGRHPASRIKQGKWQFHDGARDLPEASVVRHLLAVKPEHRWTWTMFGVAVGRRERLFSTDRQQRAAARCSIKRDGRGPPLIEQRRWSRRRPRRGAPLSYWNVAARRG